MSNRFNVVAALMGALAAIGCALVIYGCLLEQQFQLDLLQTSGIAGLNAYLAKVASHQLSFASFMVESLSGDGYARSAFVQGVGFWFVFVLTPVAALISACALAAPNRTSSRLRLVAAH
jgi:hypothetical protein